MVVFVRFPRENGSTDLNETCLLVLHMRDKVIGYLYLLYDLQKELMARKDALMEHRK